MLPFGLSGGKVIVALIAAAAVLAIVYGLYKSVYNSGYRDGYAKLTEYIKNQRETTVATERVIEKVVKEVEIKYVDRIKIVKEKGDVITKTVTEYVTTPDDAACTLRNGWVRTHDAAASNQPAGPAAESDRDPAGIALSEATAVVADNYTRYHSCRQQVIGWNEFWSKYKTALKAAGCVPE